MTRSLVGQRRSRAEVGGYPLVCFERGVKADHQKGICVGTLCWLPGTSARNRGIFALVPLAARQSLQERLEDKGVIR